MRLPRLHPEARTALKFAAVGGIGFLTDITLLRLGLVAGLSSLEARAVSLACAMQVTFLVNGLFVFRCLKLKSCSRQWLAYMAANGFGNLCNYAVYAGLVTSRLPVVSHRGWAVVIGSLAAYLINYAFTRLMVFGRPERPRPEPARAMCEAAE